MKNDWLCKCKHIKQAHTIWMKAHQYDNGSWRPESECACSICNDETKCIWYVPASNLEYLEYKSVKA